MIRLCQREGAVISIIGRPLAGKTVCAYRLAQILQRPTYAVSPQEKPPDGVQRIKLTDIQANPPPHSTLILDDILGYMGSRDYGDTFVQLVEEITQTARHERKLMLIFCMQVSSMADKYALTGDMVILKPPSILYADLERPSVKKLQDRASLYWQGKSEKWLQRHCYAISHEFEGLARVDCDWLKT